MSELTTIETRFKNLNPVPDPIDPSTGTPELDVSPADLQGWMGNMQTQKPTKPEVTPHRRWSVAVAAAFVVALVVGGVAMLVLANTNTDDPADSVVVSTTTAVVDAESEIPDQSSSAISNMATAFVDAWNEGTYVQFDSIEISYGEAERSRRQAEQEEQFLFRRALESHLELGDCTENSSSSITCGVTQSDRAHDLLSGGPDDGYVMTIRTDDLGNTGLVAEWSFTLVPGRDPGHWGEWATWAKANSTLLLEIDPRADTGGQLDMSAEEAADRYIAEIERFLAESGLG